MPMNGHLDTVPECKGWTAPVSGEKRGDRLYGLGALDMKSGCASLMTALAHFKKDHPVFRGKIKAALVSVEEGPFGLGTNALIEDGLLDDVDFCIVTEPSAGFTSRPFPTLCLGARGDTDWRWSFTENLPMRRHRNLASAPQRIWLHLFSSCGM